MGRGCCSVAVNYAYFAMEPSTYGEPAWEQIVDNIELWAEMKDDVAHPGNWNPPAWYTNKTDAQLGYGWAIEHKKSSWECFVGYDNIFVAVIRNGDKAIYGINSSQYSNVGEVEMVYFADDENHLQDFLNDFFPGETYDSNAAVQQWG